VQNCFKKKVSTIKALFLGARPQTPGVRFADVWATGEEQNYRFLLQKKKIITIKVLFLGVRLSEVGTTCAKQNYRFLLLFLEKEDSHDQSTSLGDTFQTPGVGFVEVWVTCAKQNYRFLLLFLEKEYDHIWTKSSFNLQVNELRKRKEGKFGGIGSFLYLASAYTLPGHF
jgi:hypothetical protein